MNKRKVPGGSGGRERRYGCGANKTWDESSMDKLKDVREAKWESIDRKLVRTSLLFGAETWATMKRQEKRMEVNEMRMLRWMCGVTKKDKIRNEHVTGSVKVAPVTKPNTVKRLKWHGRVKRRNERYVQKIMFK